MMVVPVLMISCQVSLKPKIGPLSAHAMMMSTAVQNVAGRPEARAVDFAKRVNRLRLVVEDFMDVSGRAWRSRSKRLKPIARFAVGIGLSKESSDVSFRSHGDCLAGI